MLQLLLSALQVEEGAKQKAFDIVSSCSEMERLREVTSTSPAQRILLQTIQEEVSEFLQQQHTRLSARRISACWLRCRDRKRFEHARSIYNEGRNKRIHGMLQREVSYIVLISQLTQRFAVPLLNSSDRALLDESQDFREILQAIVDIERLHRYVQDVLGDGKLMRGALAFYYASFVALWTTARGRMWMALGTSSWTFRSSSWRTGTLSFSSSTL